LVDEQKLQGKMWTPEHIVSFHDSQARPIRKGKLIQKTQNRATQTIHLKLDELIRVTKGARNMMLDLEHTDDESLKRLRDIYERLGSQARSDKKEKNRSG
jgi:Low affinity iron permease